MIYVYQGRAPQFWHKSVVRELKIQFGLCAGQQACHAYGRDRRKLSIRRMQIGWSVIDY